DTAAGRAVAGARSGTRPAAASGRAPAGHGTRARGAARARDGRPRGDVRDRALVDRRQWIVHHAVGGLLEGRTRPVRAREAIARGVLDHARHGLVDIAARVALR